MYECKIKLKNRTEVAEGTLAFYFEKPEGFEFQAGQYLKVTLLNHPEIEGKDAVRFFSIASAPFEPDLMIATRMRNSPFKRILGSMPVGSEVNIQGPFGSLVLHEDSSIPAIILTGGIGITPFRSICLQAAYEKLPHRIFLFYSNRRPEDGAFLEELIELEQENPNYTCINTMTDMENSRIPWKGETGYITRKMIEKYGGEGILQRAIYYIAGPEGMVQAMEKMLRDSGVSEKNIVTENFTGY